MFINPIGGEVLKLLLFIVAISLTACNSLSDIKTQERLVFSGKLKGSHMYLARCVTDKMENDEEWGIRNADYRMRDYKDIKKIEIISSASGGYGTIYGISLELTEIDNNNTDAKLYGVFRDVKVAHKHLDACSAEWKKNRVQNLKNSL